MPKITKNLLLINCIIFALQNFIPAINNLCPLNYILMGNFRFWQPFTYMFLHGSLSHLFFNMFALWMFGTIIERTMGSQRFLIYYIVCGVGAGICQELWQTFQLFVLDNPDLGSTIGASGAVYGVLLAFGMFYPNERIMLLIPPIPMKAKYLVAGYIAIEVISLGTADNIAHFAHLGGILFGWLLIIYWRRQNKRRQQARFKGWNVYQQPPTFRSTSSQHHATMNPVGGKQYHQQQQTIDLEYQIKKKQTKDRINAILDKIKASGYDSLTQEEKDFLFNNT